jgi:hypothetical protein
LAEMDSTSDSTQHNTPDQNYCWFFASC